MVCPHPRQSMCGAGVLTPRLSRVKPWIAAVPPRQAASQHQQIRRGWSRRTARCRADAASTEARQRAARALLRDIATAAPCPERWPELAAEGVHLFQPPITAPPSWHKLQRELQGRPVVDTLRAQLSDEQVPAARTHGPLGHRCQLTRRPWGRVFSDPSLTHYTLSLFAAITTAWQHTTPTTHLPSVTLSRYDLFHAHMVLTGQNCTEPDAAQSHTSGSYPSGSHAGQEGFREQGSDGLDQDAYTTGLSLVFHCMETPAYHDTRFPYYLGHCQEGSSLVFHERAFDKRTVVYHAGVLAFVDTGQGMPLHDSLLWDELRPLRTVLESDFGPVVGDVNVLLAPRKLQHAHRAQLGVTSRKQSSLQLDYSKTDNDRDARDSAYEWWQGSLGSFGSVPHWQGAVAAHGGKAALHDLRECSQVLVCLEHED